MSFTNFRNSLLGKEEEPSLWGELKEEFCCSLSLKQRIIGFAICMGLAILLFFMAMFFVGSIVLSPASFAVPYTFANILALGGTFFLVGPLRQLKMMCKPARLTATIIYLVAMALTLWAAFTGKGLLVILFIIIQVAAVAWYVFSYIPFARSCVKNCCSSIVSI